MKASDIEYCVEDDYDCEYEQVQAPTKHLFLNENGTIDTLYGENLDAKYNSMMDLQDQQEELALKKLKLNAYSIFFSVTSALFNACYLAETWIFGYLDYLDISIGMGTLGLAAVCFAKSQKYNGKFRDVSQQLDQATADYQNAYHEQICERAQRHKHDEELHSYR